MAALSSDWQEAGAGAAVLTRRLGASTCSLSFRAIWVWARAWSRRVTHVMFSWREKKKKRTGPEVREYTFMRDLCPNKPARGAGRPPWQADLA